MIETTGAKHTNVGRKASEVTPLSCSSYWRSCHTWGEELRILNRNSLVIIGNVASEPSSC